MIKKVWNQRVEADKESYRKGLLDAATWIAEFDKQLAPVVNGYRFSDMLLCKLNLTKRKRPRKIGTDLSMVNRLLKIAQIIEAVDNRCMAADGPVTKTQDEITDKEFRQIYLLAKGSR